MSLGTEKKATRSLGELINIATRPVHTKLNKLIIYRLPLAIPPHADEPSNYVSGLLHVTPVYNTFESLWRGILESPSPTPKQSLWETILKSPGAVNESVLDDHSCDVCKPSAFIHHKPNALDAPHRPTVCTRIHSLLAHLHLPELERTEALKEDIGNLTGWSPSLLEEQLASSAESPTLSAFLQHTRQAVQERPHVLLAYAWVLYMALFSGGRFIRASLARVEPSFWAANSTSLDPVQNPDFSPLRFFSFDSPEDGEEIKLAFKSRLAESECLLTDEEKEDVVAEAQRIFDFMVAVVGELDEVCSTDPLDKEGTEETVMGRVGRLLGLRTRDSVIVTKERRAWAKLGDEQAGNAEEITTANGGGSKHGES
jgi:heme oxygenase